MAERATPIATERPGVKRSIVCIHFGRSACAPARGRERHWRTAIPNRTTARMSLSQLTQSAGAPWSLAPAPLERSRMIPPTTAMIGIGLNATPGEDEDLPDDLPHGLADPP